MSVPSFIFTSHEFAGVGTSTLGSLSIDMDPSFPHWSLFVIGAATMFIGLPMEAYIDKQNTLRTACGDRCPDTCFRDETDTCRCTDADGLITWRKPVQEPGGPCSESPDMAGVLILICPLMAQFACTLSQMDKEGHMHDHPRSKMTTAVIALSCFIGPAYAEFSGTLSDASATVCWLLLFVVHRSVRCVIDNFTERVPKFSDPLLYGIVVFEDCRGHGAWKSKNRNV